MTALLVHSGSLTDVECALQLGWASIEILHASLPTQAIRLLETSRPSVVVIDTGDGGLRLAKEVRRRSNAVIVAVSSRYDALVAFSYAFIFLVVAASSDVIV